MGKQWYMWYTSNWNNSDRVFELNLAERGLYRELIDRAMHNDNVVPFDLTKMARRLNSNPDELTKILAVLIKNELVIEKENGLFIPECEPRLNLIRGGRKGGEKSRKNKPIPKPIPKPTPKPTPNQRKEKERKEKEIKQQSAEVDSLFFDKIDGFINSIGKVSETLWRESFYRSYGLKKGSLSLLSKDFKDHLIKQPPDFLDRYDFKEFKKHLDNWVRRKHQSGDLIKYKKDQTQKGDL